MFKATAIALAAIGLTDARISYGGCPNAPNMDNFD